MKGLTCSELIGGKCKFEKIRIGDVSSHFCNGCFYLVVAPVNNSMGIEGQNQQDIMPFVLEKVKVKAKARSKKQKSTN